MSVIEKNRLFVCPVCMENLKLSENKRSFKCIKNHSYDIAKQGYVNILISNMKNSAAPGDSREMVISRADFLNKGFYEKISDKINEIILKYTKEQHPVILDLGCGEGYYISRLIDAFEKENKSGLFYGSDISKDAIKYAAVHEKRCLFAVANSFHLPAADNSCDCIISVFSPIDIKEINRVLKKDGVFLRILPKKNHLIELRKIIYEKVILNETENYISDVKDNILEKEENVEYKLNLDNEDFMHLLKMTPHFWKSSKKNHEKLNQYKSLEITISMRIGIFKKK